MGLLSRMMHKKDRMQSRRESSPNREAFERLLLDMGFVPEVIHYAKSSIHEGFPEKAWYFPRPDDSRESLALISVYEDGDVVLREYMDDGGKPETAWNLCNLAEDFDSMQTTSRIEESIRKQKIKFIGDKEE